MRTLFMLFCREPPGLRHVLFAVERRPAIERFPMVEIDLLFQQFFSLVKRFDARVAGSPPLRGRKSDKCTEDCR